MALTLMNRLLCAGAFLLFSVASGGQSKPAPTVHTPDGDITIPVALGVLGHQDVVALAELADHLTVVGTSSWIGMQGTGTIVYGPQGSTAYAATLTNAGMHSFRLDAQTKKEPMSIRIHRQVGKIQDSDGRFSAIPTDTALTGLFPFELVRRSQFPEASTSILDHGLVTIGGTPLHRITLEIASMGQNPVTKLPNTIAVDLYFDPVSHLLMKSVTSSLIPDGRSAHFLFVVTYGDYRQVGSSMIPFLYTETMQGEPYWTLQLSDVQLNPTLEPQYFQF